MPTDGTPLTELTDAHDGETITVYSHTGTTLSGRLIGSWQQSPAFDGKARTLVLMEGFPAQCLPATYRFVTYQI